MRPGSGPTTGQHPKNMITWFWNPAGFHVSDFLVGELFNGNYFMRSVLTPIHLFPMVAAAYEQKIYSAHEQLVDAQIKSCTGGTLPDVRAPVAASSLFI
jgi:hypothetical protein